MLAVVGAASVCPPAGTQSRTGRAASALAGWRPGAVCPGTRKPSSVRSVASRL